MHLCHLVPHSFFPFQHKNDSAASPTLSEEGQLLEALRRKAEAFSNEAWTQYWDTYGPSLLVTGWVTAHPLVSLEQLQRVCAVDCLTQAMGQLGLGASGGHTLEDNAGSGSGTVVAEVSEMVLSEHVETPTTPLTPPTNGAAQEGHNIRNGMAEASEMVHPELPTSPTANGETQDGMPLGEGIVEGESGDGVPSPGPSPPPTSEEAEVARKWSKLYNVYYWYCYQVFCSGAEGGGDDVEVNGGGAEVEVNGGGADVEMEGGREIGDGEEAELGNGEGGGADVEMEGNGWEVVEEVREDDGAVYLEGAEVVGEVVKEAVSDVVSEVLTTAVSSDDPASLGCPEVGGAGMECEEVGGGVAIGADVAGHKRWAHDMDDVDEEEVERKR